MHENEQAPESPKRHILLFIGVTIVLTLALLAGLHFFQQRSNTAPVSGDPQVGSNEPAKPEEKPAPEAVPQEEKKTPTPKPDANPVTPKPTQIAATGAAESLIVVVPALVIIAYVANEYRRSRAALARAAMHEVTTL